MNLSREATIKLRPASGDWQPPTVSWLAQPWTVTHATGSPYNGKKNVRAEPKLAADRKLRTFQLSHQDAKSLEIKSSSLSMSPSDWSEAENTASRFTLPKSTLEVLAWGKEGQLSDWMTEEAGWIADRAGESRPDWRRSYAVVRVDHGQVPHVEVWGSRPLTDETIGKIKDALKGAALDGDLLPMVMDDGRDKDDHDRWLKENGPICADIDLSEPEEKASCRCVVL
ncbi:hypothetical protein OQA88_1213 [Cercophora sp. LCS_1]